MTQQDELIDTIYQASYQPEHWPQVMALLAAITCSKSAALLIHDKELRHMNGFFPHGIPKPVTSVYRSIGVQIDPGFKRMQNIPVGIAHPIVDLSSADGDITAFENIILRPAGIHAVLGINLINNEKIHAGIGIHRSREQGSFDKTTCSIIESLTPHLIRAITIYREFARVNARAHALHAGLEYLSIGAILFDHLASPIYMNPRARYLFEHHPATTVYDDLPIVLDKDLAKRVQNAVIGAIEGDFDEQTLGLFHSQSSSPLVVRIVSVKEKEKSLPSVGLARCIMYVSDPELSSSIQPEVLQSIYGLTTAESEVAVGLANGYSINEIAHMHNVQPGTVRVQIKSIFQKVGVNRQSELVRIILSIPAVWNETPTDLPA